MRVPFVALLAACLGACSADEAPVPEPRLETPGAFVAVETDAGGYVLHRTLTVLLLENGEELVFSTVYRPEARDFAEAQAFAKDPDLPKAADLNAALRSELTARTWKVVWFRTLTREELDAVL